MANKYTIEFFRYVDDGDEATIVYRPLENFPDLATAISQGAMMFATIQASHQAEGFQIKDAAGHVVAQRYEDDFGG
jgi:hypothetical protein